MMRQSDTAVIEKIIGEIDELLAMRQGFNEAYRQWRETSFPQLSDVVGEERFNEIDRLGPRQVPVNRQHRVHIYRQRLHAQRKYLSDLLEAQSSGDETEA